MLCDCAGCSGLAVAACLDRLQFKSDDEGYLRNWLLLEPFEVPDEFSSLAVPESSGVDVPSVSVVASVFVSDLLSLLSVADWLDCVPFLDAVLEVSGLRKNTNQTIR